MRCGRFHTYYQIRVELLRNWHDHLLERIHVVPIAHPLTGPGYVDISEKVISKWFKDRAEERVSDLPTPAPAPQ